MPKHSIALNVKIVLTQPKTKISIIYSKNVMNKDYKFTESELDELKNLSSKDKILKRLMI